ncbi:MAG TPA: hypothetical protein VG056_03455 [Pirellulales bacterium]|jgi:hypothetical protein|nr:hypothetical protein [Pirellulales bacterium]
MNGLHPRNRATLSRPRWIEISVAILLAIWLGIPSQLLAATDPNTAVQSGHDALGPSGRFPWYDSDRDDVRPVNLHTSDDSTDDSSKGKSTSRGQPGDGSGSGGSGDGSGSSGGNDSSMSIDPSVVSAPALMWIAWIAIAAVLLWIVYMLIRAFLDREARNAKPTDSQDAAEEVSDEDRLDALPTRVSAVKGGLLDEARRQYEAGNYNTAIIYLYSYQLIKLDQNQMLRLAKGKTNRQYLRELAVRPELYGILAQSLVPFEDVFFGEHQLARERFEACWNQVDRFNRLVEQAST